MSKSRIFYFCFCFVFLILGVWRYQILELRIGNNELNNYNDLEQEIIVVDIVVDIGYQPTAG